MIAGKFTNSQLLQVSNYLNDKFKNKNISEIKKIIEAEISQIQDQVLKKFQENL